MDTLQPRPGTTETLARFVVETRWEDIPETARHEAKRGRNRAQVVVTR